MSNKDILKGLLMNEDEALKEMVSLLQPLLGINEKNGSVIIKIPKEKLTDYQAILLYLVGIRFAFDLSLRDKSTAKSNEIADYFNKDAKTISTRLSELKNLKKVKSSERGMYTIEPLSIRGDIETIIKDLK